jgi:hypothetical protein
VKNDYGNEKEAWALNGLEEPLKKIKIFGPMRDEVTGGWRKLHNEELHNFYSSPNIIRMIKTRRMR